MSIEEVANRKIGKCKCLDSWTDDYTPECAKEQKGCTNCDGSNFSWCNVANPGCSTDEDGEGWSYCFEEEGEECRCKESWTDDYHPGCAKEQHGCTNCDDSWVNWCHVSNPGCATDKGGKDPWSYCTGKTHNLTNLVFFEIE